MSGGREEYCNTTSDHKYDSSMPQDKGLAGRNCRLLVSLRTAEGPMRSQGRGFFRGHTVARSGKNGCVDVEYMCSQDSQPGRQSLPIEERRTDFYASGNRVSTARLSANPHLIYKQMQW